MMLQMKNQSKFEAVLAALLLLFAALPLWADPVDKIVTIYTKVGTSESGQGTGFFIGSDGEIVTAYHVVNGATEIKVFDNANVEQRNTRVLALLPGRDLALLKVQRHVTTPLQYSTSVPSSRSQVTIIGSPRGMLNQSLVGLTTTSSLISSLTLSLADGKPVFRMKIDVLPIDITVNNGLSGAPALDEDDSVIGVLSGSYAEGRGITWLIPSEYIQELLEMSRNEQSVRDIVAWPAFNLMSSNWRSLKRSYKANFSARHMQKLEVMEGALSRAGGVWNAQSVESKEVGFYVFSTCESTQTIHMRLSFNDLNAVDGVIVGTFRYKSNFAATFTVDPNSNYPPAESYRKQCYASVTGDGESEHSAIQTTGTFIAEAADESGKVLGLTLNITECTLGKCDGSSYGEFDGGEITLVSDSVATSGNLVLKKQ
jgi:Trypsin-like peptidase domain